MRRFGRYVPIPMFYSAGYDKKSYRAGPIFTVLLSEIKTQRVKLNDDVSVKEAEDAIEQIMRLSKSRSIRQIQHLIIKQWPPDLKFTLIINVVMLSIQIRVFEWTLI